MGYGRGIPHMLSDWSASDGVSHAYACVAYTGTQPHEVRMCLPNGGHTFSNSASSERQAAEEEEEAEDEEHDEATCSTSSASGIPMFGWPTALRAYTYTHVSCTHGPFCSIADCFALQKCWHSIAKPCVMSALQDAFFGAPRAACRTP